MKLQGRLHRLWFWWVRNTYLSDVRWVWRPVCWLGRHHQDRPQNPWLDWNGSMVTKKTHLCASCGYVVDGDIHRYRQDPPRRYLNRL